MNMLIRRIRIMNRNHVIAGIASVRQDWELSENKDLIGTKGSVGLLLADIAAAVGLLPEEQAQALGQELYRKVDEYCQ